MATHDYVIANGTGAAVRSDLNNALAAIVSNNSGSSEPGTTYAFQWWADTNANVLKIRNSSNDGWITLRELDGTMLIEDGSAASPGLAFADDTNTGIYSGANNQIGFTTDGVERFKIQTAEAVFNDESNDFDFRVESNGNTHMLFVDAGNNRVAIGTSTINTNTMLSVHRDSSSESQVRFTNTTTGAGGDNGFIVGIDTAEAARIFNMENGPMRFGTNNTERMRIDSSGRLLVGRTSALNVGASSSATTEIQNSSGFNLSLISTINSSGAGGLAIGKARGGSVVQDDDDLGSIVFAGHDGTDFETRGASITAQVDGTPGSNDMPSRLTFGTTSDGASSPTERFRIDSEGHIKHTGLRAGAGENKLANYTVPSHNTNEEDVLVFTVANESSSNQITFGGGPSAYNAATAILFRTASAVDTTVGSEAMRIDSSGRLLVGTSSSTTSQHLQIQGDTGGANNGGTILLKNGVADSSAVSGTGLGGIAFGGSTGNQYCRIEGFADGNGGTDDYPGRISFSVTADGGAAPTERIRITKTGALNVGSSKLTAGAGDGNIVVDEGVYIAAFNGDNQIRGNSAGSGSATLFIGNSAIQVSSDRRIKENIVDTVVDAAEELKRIRIVDFTWNDPLDTSFNNRNARGTWTGLIAQELIDVFPFAVNAPRLEEDLSVDHDSEKRWHVNQDQLVPVLIKGFQQALARIETLETKVAALEAG